MVQKLLLKKKLDLERAYSSRDFDRLTSEIEAIKSLARKYQIPVENFFVDITSRAIMDRDVDVVKFLADLQVVNRVNEDALRYVFSSYPNFRRWSPLLNDIYSLGDRDRLGRAALDYMDSIDLEQFLISNSCLITSLTDPSAVEYSVVRSLRSSFKVLLYSGYLNESELDSVISKILIKEDKSEALEYLEILIGYSVLDRSLLLPAIHTNLEILYELGYLDKSIYDSVIQLF